MFNYCFFIPRRRLYDELAGRPLAAFLIGTCVRWGGRSCRVAVCYDPVVIYGVIINNYGGAQQCGAQRCHLAALGSAPQILSIGNSLSYPLTSCVSEGCWEPCLRSGPEESYSGSACHSLLPSAAENRPTPERLHKTCHSQPSDPLKHSVAHNNGGSPSLRLS